MTRRRRKSRRAKKGSYTSTKTGQICKYRSNWEKLYLQYLDSDPNVSHWIYEPFAIPYVSNKRTGKVRKYHPDVYVVKGSRKLLIEIKPSSRVKKPAVMKKAAAARAWCVSQGIEYLFVTESDLKVLGLL